MTLIHSSPFTPSRPPWMAMAAPVRPAMRLWLSDVGMPNTEAPTLYTTIENSAAHNAMSAASVLPPKSTMLEMVEATLALIFVITRTPRKLSSALMMMAGFTRMQGVSPAVDKDDAEREKRSERKGRARENLPHEVRERDVQAIPLLDRHTRYCAPKMEDSLTCALQKTDKFGGRNVEHR